MDTIRWVRVILSTVFLLLGLAFGSYFYIQKYYPTPIALEGCAVNFSPDGSSQVIKFGDPRCPK